LDCTGYEGLQRKERGGVGWGGKESFVGEEQRKVAYLVEIEKCSQ